MTLDRILMQGLHFYGYHGVLAEEERRGQPFIIDLELFADLRRAAETDDLNATVNYAEVYKTVKTAVTRRRFQLIEALAGEIAAQVLAGFPVAEVLVRVRKPEAPIPGTFDYVAVEIRRRREG